MEASEVIERLGLKRLPAEGGFYREIYRARGVIPGEALPVHDGARAYATSIYYLITPEDFSTLHKVKSDEIFHFYRGDPVEMIQIDASGWLEEMETESRAELVRELPQHRDIIARYTVDPAQQYVR